MKTLHLIAAAALGVTGAIASAQTYDATTSPSAAGVTSPAPSGAATPAMPSSTMSAQPTEPSPAPAPSSTTSSSTSSGTSQPARAEVKEDLRTEPSPPADLRAAREEAVNALHWAKTEGCRGESSPRECIREAEEEYRETIARLGSDRTMARAGDGTVSGAGTSGAAGSDERAPRSDRH